VIDLILLRPFNFHSSSIHSQQPNTIPTSPPLPPTIPFNQHSNNSILRQPWLRLSIAARNNSGGERIVCGGEYRVVARVVQLRFVVGSKEDKINHTLAVLLQSCTIISFQSLFCVTRVISSDRNQICFPPRSFERKERKKRKRLNLATVAFTNQFIPFLFLLLTDPSASVCLSASK